MFRLALAFFVMINFIYSEKSVLDISTDGFNGHYYVVSSKIKHVSNTMKSKLGIPNNTNTINHFSNIQIKNSFRIKNSTHNLKGLQGEIILKKNEQTEQLSFGIVAKQFNQ